MQLPTLADSKPDAFYGASYLDILCVILNYILVSWYYAPLFFYRTLSNA